MTYAALKKTAQHLQSQAAFLVEIANTEEYEKALALMDELIDDYYKQQVLIELLSNRLIGGKTTAESLPNFTSALNMRVRHISAAISDGSIRIGRWRSNRDWQQVLCHQNLKRS